MKQLKAGDRVKYSKNFLRLAEALEGDVPLINLGMIISLERLGKYFLAEVIWEGEDFPRKALSYTLVRVGD